MPELPDDAVPVADLVVHQPGAVVSRVLAKRSGGVVTAFAFDAGEELTKHTVPFDALVFVVEGQLEIAVGDRSTRVAAGSLLRLPGGVPHAVHAPVPAKMVLVMLRDAAEAA